MVKYCYWDERNHVWNIRRSIKGKLTHFGSYPSEEECEVAVELYEESGWKKEDNWRIKAKVKEILKNNGG